MIDRPPGVRLDKGMTGPPVSPRGVTPSRQLLLNLVISFVAGVAVVAITDDVIWAVVAFLLSGLLAHTVLLAFRLRMK